MKTKSIFFSTLLALTAFTLLTNCSSKKDDATEDSHDHAMNGHAAEGAATEVNAPQFEVSEAFQQQLGNVFTSYVSLKDAFIASDVQKVKSEATNTIQSVDKVDMKLVTGAAHNDWMTYLTPIKNSLMEIQSSSDIEVQREAFSTLSDNLYKSIKAFGLGGKEGYYEYCPMAFDYEGAYWLSNEEKIQNPYFGDKMLTCGEVREKLQ